MPRLDPWGWALLASGKMTFVRLLGVVALIASQPACVQSVAPPPPGGGTGATSGTGATGGTGASGGTGGRGAPGGTGGTSGTGGVGGSAGSGGMSGAGGTGAAGGTGGGAGIGGVGGAGGAGGMGACLQQADIDAITALFPTSAREVAAGCGVSCAGPVSDQSFLACTNPCVQEVGVSPDCASCYGDFALCIRLTCLFQCALDACRTECEACPGYQPCANALNLCAGRDSDDCTN